MRSPEQVRWDFVQQWLDKAENDLRATEILLKSDLKSFETIAFHAQQSAEKFIKALLVRHQVEFPKIHDISKLRNLILKIDRSLSVKLEPADALTPYGVEFRYPGDFDLNHQHATKAFQLAKRVKRLIMNHLKSYLAQGRPIDPEE